MSEQSNSVLTRNNARASVAAFAAAALFLIATGIATRTLATSLDRVDSVTPLEVGLLATLPLELDAWRGQDQPLDARIVRAADVDDYLNRVYRRGVDGTTVGLYIAFGARARDLAPHRPEVCYPGNGWTMRGSQDTRIRTPSGRALHARILRFEPNSLSPTQLIVLNYYIIDGKTAEDVSALRWQLWRGQSSVRYMAQIQITCSYKTSGSDEPAAKAVRAFAALVADRIERLLSTAIGAASAG